MQIKTDAVAAQGAVTSKPDYESEIIKIIRGNYSPKAAQNRLEDYHGNDIAQAMDSLTLQERKKLYRICSASMLAEAFEHLEDEEADRYFSETDIKKASAIVAELDPETAADILHNVEKERRALIIDSLQPDVKNAIMLIASFDDDEIGSKMTTNFISIRENLTIKEAMKLGEKDAKKLLKKYDK